VPDRRDALPAALRGPVKGLWSVLLPALCRSLSMGDLRPKPVEFALNTHEEVHLSIHPNGGVEVIVRGPKTPQGGRGPRYLTLLLAPMESKRLGKLLWQAGEVARSKRQKP